MRRVAIITLMLILIVSCSNGLILKTQFRGDVPFKFNLKSFETQEGKEITLTVSLFTRPSSNVTMSFIIDDTSEVEFTSDSVSTTSLVFSPDNYSTAQVIRMRAVDDCEADGTQSTTVRVQSITTNDSFYDPDKASAGSNFKLSDLTTNITVNDSSDNLPRIVFSKSSDLNTDEQGREDFFQVKLSCAPTATVTVPLVIDKTTEVSISNSSLAFSPTNFSSAQKVIVTGQPDCTSDTNQAFTISTGTVTTTDSRFDRYSQGTQAKVTGTNKNIETSNTLVYDVSGGLSMTLYSNTGDVNHDPFAQFTVKVACSITSNHYFKLSFENTSATKPFAEVTSLGVLVGTASNPYILFTSTTFNSEAFITLKADLVNSTLAQFQSKDYQVTLSECDASGNLLASPAFSSISFPVAITVVP